MTVTQAPEEVPVTRASLREYAVRQRERYAQATTRSQKCTILDEVVAIARIHRKAAIRLLRRRASLPRRARRPRHYGPDVAAAAEVLWQTAGRKPSEVNWPSTTGRRSRPLKRVQLRGGAREPHAKRTPCTLSVRPRAPYLRKWALFSGLRYWVKLRARRGTREPATRGVLPVR